VALGEKLGLFYDFGDAIIRVEMVDEGDKLGENRLTVGDQDIQKLFVFFHVITSFLYKAIDILLFNHRSCFDPLLFSPTTPNLLLITTLRPLSAYPSLTL